MFRILYLIPLLLLTAFAVQAEKRKGTVLSEERMERQFQFLFYEGVRNSICGNIEEAELHFRNCLSIDPHSSAARYELARIFLQEEQYDDALEMIQAGVKDSPDNTWYRELQAAVLEKQSRISECCRIYRGLIRLDPDKVDYYLLPAVLCSSSGKWKEALYFYRLYEKKFGFDKEISLAKIRIYRSLAKLDRAASEINGLVRRFPDNPKYRMFLPDFLFSCGEEKKGIQACHLLISSDTANAFLHFYLADHFMGRKDSLMASREVMEGFSSPYIDPAVKSDYFIKLATEGGNRDPRTLSSYIRVLLDCHGSDLGIRLLYSDWLKNCNREEEALQELEYISGKDKKNFVVWNELLTMYMAKEDTLSLYRKSVEAVRYFPEQPLPYLYSAVCLAACGRFADALGYLNRGCILAGDDRMLLLQFYTHMGDCLYHTGNKEDAFRIFEKVLDINPLDVLVLNNYAYYLCLEDMNLSLAEKMSAEAVVLESDNPTLLDTYAWILYKRGNYSQAAFYMKLAMEKEEGMTALHYEHYGDILFKCGHEEEALEMWNRAVNAGGKGTGLEYKVKYGVLPD